MQSVAGPCVKYSRPVHADTVLSGASRPWKAAPHPPARARAERQRLLAASAAAVAAPAPAPAPAANGGPPDAAAPASHAIGDAPGDAAPLADTMSSGVMVTAAPPTVADVSALRDARMLLHGLHACCVAFTAPKPLA